MKVALQIVCAAFLTLALSACGVKQDLDLPSGAMPDKTKTDPSKPEYPLGGPTNNSVPPNGTQPIGA